MNSGTCRRLRLILVTSAAVSLLLGAPALAQTGPRPAKPAYPLGRVAPKGAPNVLLIMTDDVGFAASSAFGGPVPTPTFDRVGADGLRYSRFHTTALCSPTRAALLTGRNAHSVGSGMITELATSDKGYTSVLPQSAATIGEVLRDNGYSTAWLGKNHNTPDWETGPAGPFDRWPTGLGFDYFYGFHGGDTNQWAPALIENTRTVEPPTANPSYILDRDLADHAIDWLNAQRSTNPGKPFLLYYAPGTAHAPHHAPAEWIARFKGKFDAGWDAMREASFARQKAQGVIPADAKLTPRPAEIAAWASLSPDQKRLYARMMEVYAASLAHADAQIGRVIEHLRRSGQLDNTILIYIQGDNGASGEGGVQGTTNEMAALNGQKEPLDFALSHIDDLGGPKVFGHYPVGWAWAMNTPFQWTKQVASHFGGTRNGMALSWPGHIADKGAVRPQFGHVIDIAPTLYEAIGIAPPATVAGVRQQPIEGTSLMYTLKSPAAPDRHRTQYFEMFANRAIYHDGWMASTKPKRVPWVFTAEGVDPASFTWELYNIGRDFSQLTDLAAAQPAKLTSMVALFDREARTHNVYPLAATAAERFSSALRPYPLGGLKDFTYYPGPTRYSTGAFPDIRNRSWSLSAAIDVTSSANSGTIVTQGGYFNGWGLLMRGGKPVFIYRRSNQPADLTEITAPDVLAPGHHNVSVDFAYDGGGPGRGGAVSLKIDGAQAATGRLQRTVPASFTIEGAAIGHDTGTAISTDCAVPCRFNGTIASVEIKLR
jgi:arylsulfatase A-like enzyme